MIDVYKKENFVCIVCWFADNLLDEVLNILKSNGVKYRLIRNPSKWGEENEIVEWKNIKINRDELVKLKQKLMKV